ncbi:MAG: hypothetical protein ACOZNI_30845 [Myxococcota bacterium]
MGGWERFREVAEERLPDGRRALVPVVGAGFNLQAGGGPDWGALIELVAGEAHAPAIEALDSMTARWEALLRRHAGARDEPAHVVEEALQRDVCRHLRVFEAEAARRDLYRRFLALGFRDVLSLNFDRTLALAGGGRRVTGRGSLRRRAESAGTRVWYPHGDTLRADTLKLGIRQYGRYLEVLGHRFEAMKLASRHAGDDWHARARTHRDLSWDWLIYTAPVVFLGCSLTADEWPMWWVLHQRARELARAREAPPAFVLTCGEPSHLKGGPADIVVLEAGTHEEGWERFFESFS